MGSPGGPRNSRDPAVAGMRRLAQPKRQFDAFRKRFGKTILQS